MMNKRLWQTVLKAASILLLGQAQLKPKLNRTTYRLIFWKALPCPLLLPQAWANAQVTAGLATKHFNSHTMESKLAWLWCLRRGFDIDGRRLQPAMGLVKAFIRRFGQYKALNSFLIEKKYHIEKKV